MPDSSTLALLARLVISLGVVIGLMLLLAGVLRRRGLVVGNGARSKSRGGWEIDVLARKGLGRTAQLAVVRAGGRTLVIGITEQHVTALAEADPDSIAAINATNDLDLDGGAQWTGLQGTGTPGTGPTWKTMLDVVRDRTTRR